MSLVLVGGRLGCWCKLRPGARQLMAAAGVGGVRPRAGNTSPVSGCRVCIEGVAVSDLITACLLIGTICSTSGILMLSTIADSGISVGCMFPPPRGDRDTRTTPPWGVSKAMASTPSSRRLLPGGISRRSSRSTGSDGGRILLSSVTLILPASSRFSIRFLNVVR